LLFGKKTTVLKYFEIQGRFDARKVDFKIFIWNDRICGKKSPKSTFLEN